MFVVNKNVVQSTSIVNWFHRINIKYFFSIQLYAKQRKTCLLPVASALSYSAFSFLSDASSDELALFKNVSQKKNAGEINEFFSLTSSVTLKLQFPTKLEIWTTYKLLCLQYCFEGLYMWLQAIIRATLFMHNTKYPVHSYLYVLPYN